jgi:predicted anti-sigma-YlaC factor YlaD
MKVTRDVILDLLPLYLDEEASSDTKALVREYLEADPEIAQIARESASMRLSEQTPAPLRKEKEMEAYQKAKHELNRRVIILAAIFAFSTLGIVAAAFIGLSLLMR